ncbi:MAG: thiol reductase thioredoxin [Alphaproteobacteria bacterium]|uniref:Thiol reductase thioredoxin n=1 Tax=Candidatus Nitrobium versatile TaxID=2884831 RepID=A0A953M0R3_9BACT|nr:thiol reductase thioredoxin [Candidatus Nitrobium versatile]
MTEDPVLLRCPSCGTVNRVPASRLPEHPKCGKCKVPLSFPRVPVDVTDATFPREVLQWPGAVLVQFWSPRCGICRSMAPSIREIARKGAGRLKVALVNVDTEQSLAYRFRIQGVPAFFLYRNGVKVNEITGGMQEYQLKSWIDTSL